ncbi:FecCD family ABC transporter permease [Schumannella luteola]|uniref:FecCD family ABC transporter permease n=1 Tax=Schumannella luteola TaxID=472059 RepID=UPI001FE47511|nr:iron chelate uptake ABC transporter family permease subunit [Schumannella luteola]
MLDPPALPGSTGLRASSEATARVAGARRRRGRRARTVTMVLVALILIVFAVSLMVGHRFYPPEAIIRVILGETVPGASFTVGELRLQRAVLAVVAGLSFGLGGVAFQTMLRNPLASPDVIGISSGASAGAVFAIIVLSAGTAQTGAFAIATGLAVALLVYLLAFRGGSAGTRLILIGIGIAAMGNSVINYLLSTAGQWDLQEAMRWLTGSLNSASWGTAVPTLLSVLVLGPVLVGLSRSLGALRLGDDTASALGVRVGVTRIGVIVAAVGLIAVATAATGPIAFVAFLSGPIAARIVGPGAAPIVPAGLVGALLVLVADLAGQYAFGTRYPVGVVTGVLGAPYLLYLIIRTNRTGGSL